MASEKIERYVTLTVKTINRNTASYSFDACYQCCFQFMRIRVTACLVNQYTPKLFWLCVSNHHTLLGRFREFRNARHRDRFHDYYRIAGCGRQRFYTSAPRQHKHR